MLILGRRGSLFFPFSVSCGPSNDDLQVSAEKRKEIEATFDVFDTDKGGEIDSSEFRELMASLGVNLTDDQAREKLQVRVPRSQRLALC